MSRYMREVSSWRYVGFFSFQAEDGIRDADVTAVQTCALPISVMVGRGHYGAPWLAGAIAAEAAGVQGPDIPLTGIDIFEYITSHYEDMLKLYGTQQGLRRSEERHVGKECSLSSAASC